MAETDDIDPSRDRGPRDGVAPLLTRAPHPEHHLDDEIAADIVGAIRLIDGEVVPGAAEGGVRAIARIRATVAAAARAEDQETAADGE